MKKLLHFILTLTLYQIGFSQTYYVDQNATGANDGSSWVNAFTDLELALAEQDNGFTGEIRVAGGQTFYPSASRLCTSGCTSPRDYYFLIHEDIQLKGSYDVSTDTQDYSNPTILNGDVGVPDNTADNTLRVVITTNLTNTAVIDGFTITQGNANGVNYATVNNVSFANSRGGGMYNQYSSPSITNTTLVNNSTWLYGGGMCNENSSPSITNSTFVNNSAVEYGGGIFNIANEDAYSSPTIINSTFYNNSANIGGGIFNSDNSFPTLYNTALYNNTGNDIFNSSGSTNVSSANNFSETSYFLGNPGVSFTQLTVDPFVDSSDPIGADGIWGTADDGLYPANGSVLINAGDNSFNTKATDITGNPRVLFNTIDAGAYESLVPNLQPDANNILFVNKNASGGDGSGSSWANAVTELAEASLWANSIQDVAWQTSSLQIWVAAGTYTPGIEQTDSFIIPSNVTVLGGFNGTETTADERNWAENPTILSGDLNNSQTANEGDSHTIVTMLGDNAEINGFFIQWGFADDSTDNSQPAIGRSGSGVYNNGDNRIYNCTLRSNVADTIDDPEIGIGAGLISFGGTLEIINCLFNSNTASANGGAISAESGTINIINCTIANNNANKGGGVHFFNGSINATNTIFTNNSGENGNINDDGGAGTGTANYCLFFNATTGNDGNLPPNITGNNNIENTDPSYTNGYQVVYSSPVTDAGDNTANPLSLDLNAQNRISNTTIDIGAYEFQSSCEGLNVNEIIYVDTNATGTNDGTDWTNAFTDLEVALSLQECGLTGEIRVAGGQTFTPSTSRLCTNNCDSPRDYYFLIHEDIQLKGSYDVSTNTQDYSNPTILSGDIGVANDNNDNTYHVIVTNYLSNDAIIDGFVITIGLANNTESSIINGNEIYKGRGAGMYNNSSSPIASNIIFSENSAIYEGGGMYNILSNPNIFNTVFSENLADVAGGGIYNNHSSPSISNATFSMNISNYGGGIFNQNNSNSTIYNTVLHNNTPSDIYNDSTSFITAISANNFSESSYLVGSSFTQLTVNPFVDSSDSIGIDGIWGTADDGLYPANGSVLINAGDNSFNTEATDITGNPRVFDTTIDVGAYETQTTLSTETFSTTDFMVYPNPTTNMLYIKTNLNDYSYEMYNIQGQKVMASKQAINTINISQLAIGIYVLKLKSYNKTQSIKVIKQ